MNTLSLEDQAIFDAILGSFSSNNQVKPHVQTPEARKAHIAEIKRCCKAQNISDRQTQMYLASIYDLSTILEA